MTELKLSDPPELIALCREGEHGEDEVAGWAMVLPNQIVGCIPDRVGTGAASYNFDSLDSVEWILGHSGIYPVRADIRG